MEELINLACSNCPHDQIFSSESDTHSMGSEIPLVSAFHSGCDQSNRLSLITLLHPAYAVFPKPLSEILTLMTGLRTTSVAWYRFRNDTARWIHLDSSQREGDSMGWHGRAVASTMLRADFLQVLSTLWKVTVVTTRVRFAQLELDRTSLPAKMLCL